MLVENGVSTNFSFDACAGACPGPNYAANIPEYNGTTFSLIKCCQTDDCNLGNQIRISIESIFVLFAVHGFFL